MRFGFVSNQSAGQGTAGSFGVCRKDVVTIEPFGAAGIVVQTPQTGSETLYDL